MDMYAEYIKEREGLEIYTTNVGFITYFSGSNYLYIADLYVKKEHRRKGEGQKFLDYIIDKAKKEKKEYVLAQVDTTTNNFNYSIEGMLKNNFEYQSSDEDIMKFMKVINGK